jgi:prepilin-type N-terminal cleavage/methylation domain-containing protein
MYGASQHRVRIGPPPAATVQRHGYTLIEIIIVLTILSIMTASVIPMYQGSLGRVRFERASRDFVSTLKYAQERAVTDATEHRLYLNEERGAYWVTRFAGVQDGKDVYERLDEFAGAERVLPENIKIEKPDARLDRDREAHYVAFYPSGACDYATISFALDDDRSCTIKTKGRLGRLDVEQD